MRLLFCIFIILLSAQMGIADVPKTMSYQGMLTDASDKPINGNYDLTFRLYANQTGGSWLWNETHTSVNVNKGIFNVILGSKSSLNLPFNTKYWLGVAIGAGTELPRIELTSSPYSLNAQNVSDGAITTSKLANDAVTTEKVKPDVVSSVDGVSNDGGNIDLVPGPNITITGNDTANTITIGATGVWKLTGNEGTDPTSNFLGTKDNKALELRVNNLRVLRLEPNATSPNIIGGNSSNRIWFDTYGATISGGGGGEKYYINQVTDHYGTIGGGYANQAGSDDETTINATCATVGGGFYNKASNSCTTVGGGSSNEANGECATIAGGLDNKVAGDYATISGGTLNTAAGNFAIVGGGSNNHAYGINSTVPGGRDNNAVANFSFVAGSNAKAYHVGALVFSDSLSGKFASLVNNEMAVRCTGGARFVTQYSSGAPTLWAYLNPSTAKWEVKASSDVNLKASFAPVDGVDILNRLNSMPVQTWIYKGDDESIRHIGPTSQDFYAAFHIGRNDGSIGLLDAEGVALAAIQGLYEIVNEKDKKIDQQEKRIAQLEARLAAMEKLISFGVQGY